MHSNKSAAQLTSGYVSVNGLEMYYEIEGSGPPIVFIPPAFGFAGLEPFPALAEGHSVITMDLQGNGRTPDIPDRELSIERYAEDVVAFVKALGITKADFFGESYGASTAVLIALRHPEVVRRVAAYGATYGPPEKAHDPLMTHFDTPPSAESRDIQYQREAYQRVAADPSHWPVMYAKLGRMGWKGFSVEDLAAIKVPVLVVLGDHDFVRVDHSAEAARLIPNAQLAVIPDAGHFALRSEPNRVIPVVKHFFEEPDQRLPIATAAVGYHPGENR